jgi:hypothetical protein
MRYLPGADTSEYRNVCVGGIPTLTAQQLGVCTHVSSMTPACVKNVMNRSTISSTDRSTDQRLCQFRSDSAATLYH